MKRRLCGLKRFWNLGWDILSDITSLPGYMHASVCFHVNLRNIYSVLAAVQPYHTRCSVLNFLHVANMGCVFLPFYKFFAGTGKENLPTNLECKHQKNFCTKFRVEFTLWRFLECVSVVHALCNVGKIVWVLRHARNAKARIFQALTNMYKWVQLLKWRLFQFFICNA